MTGYDDAVAGWSEALRAGDTRTWADWLAASPTSAAGEHRPMLATGAHLELVRRLAAVAGADRDDTGGAFTGLADLVLATPAVGRGRVEIPLPWPGRPVPAGAAVAPPPETLPAEELLRVALGVLLRLVDGAGAVSSPPPAARFGGPLRRRFRVHGPPATAGRVRAALVAAGMVPGDFRATHLVVAGPLDRSMAEHWADLVAAGSGRTWPRLWRRRQRAGGLPRRLDASRLLAEVGAAVPASRLHLVAAATGEEAVALALRACGVRSGPATSQTAVGALADPAAVDLRRRLNPLLAAPARSGVLDGWLENRSATVPALAVPDGLRPWAAETAARIVADLLRGAGRAEYAVHGVPEVVARLLPPDTRGTVSPEATLEVALAAILAGWRARPATGSEA